MADDADTADRHLQLRILLPTEVLVEEPVTKVIAEADNGSFCLLPRHVDFVAALVPGVMSFFTPDGAEHFAAIDRGILVKCGDEVSVSTLNGVTGTDLEELEDLVEERFLELTTEEPVG